MRPRVHPALSPRRLAVAAAIGVAGLAAPLVALGVHARTATGARLVSEAAPVLLASLLLGIAALAWLCARLLAAARQIRASEVLAGQIAQEDPLTGLANREAFGRRLADDLEAGASGSVLIVDIDKYTHVNEVHGHGFGDRLLQEVGMRLRALAGPGGFVARLGGDSFAMIADRAERRGAASLAEAVLDGLRQPFAVEDRVVTVAASIGVGLASDPPTGNAGEMLRRAHAAHLHAKAGGGNRCAVFDPSIDLELREKRMIEHELRRAIETESGLWLAYQPIWDVAGERLIGCEALVRWEHPSLGSLSPGRFVPVAEACGLTDALGAWVLRRACTDAKALGLPWIAVNVSAAQFRKPGFEDEVLDLLGRVGLAPTRLQIEITEGLILDSCPSVATAMLKLRFAGVRIAIDDFGTGYSALSYLTRYKVDKIKIDRSFISRLGADAEAGAVVKAILDLARALDLEVTAEGVATAGQWAALRRLGCPELQGFLFAKPLHRDELAERIGHARRVA